MNSPIVTFILAAAICFHLRHTRKQEFTLQMSQVFPDTPGVIYRLLDADQEFSSYIGTYKFANGTVKNALSLLTPGSSIPGVDSVTGVECIINDISNIKRVDYLTDSSTFVNEWKVFLVAWDPATGEDVNNAARRIMDLFRGATSTQTVRTSEGLTARVQTVVTIPSNQPLDVDGLAVYGPQPVVELSTNLPSVAPGTQVTLTWTVSSALTAVMDNGVGAIALSDSDVFTIDKTTTYNITATNDFSSTTTGIEISVFDPIINTFEYTATANPNEYTVSWDTSYAQEIKFNGRYDWSTTDSATITVNQQTEFILEASSTQGVVTSSITITP